MTGCSLLSAATRKCAMRRRSADDHEQCPDDLLTFDGREHTTATAWTTAFNAWHTARDAWTAEHPSHVLPSTVLSDCPYDPTLI